MLKKCCKKYKEDEKMSKIKKILCMLLVCTMIITACPMLVSVSANSEENNSEPLKIEVATDKSSYSAYGIAEITVKVTNTSDETVNNISAEAVFDELAPVGKNNETFKEVESLQSGESFSFSYKATVNASKVKLNFFEKIILWFVRLFNGGYSVTKNNINDGRKYISRINVINFGKYTAENVVKILYKGNINEKDFSNMKVVDEACNKLMSSSEFKNTNSYDYKAELLMNLLKNLSKDNLVQEDSIYYSKSNAQVYFRYSCGWEMLFFLKPFDNMLAGINENSQIVETNYLKNIANISTSSIVLNTNSVKTTNETSEKKAVMVYGWDNSLKNNFYDNLTHVLENRGISTNIYYSPSLETFKTCFTDCDFLYIGEHGVEIKKGDYEETHIENLTYGFKIEGEKIFEQDKEQFFKNNKDDISNGRIIISKEPDKKYYSLILTPKFFEKYYGKNALEDSILYLGSCMGFGSGVSYNFNFASIFYNECGVDTIYGYHNSVWLPYQEVMLSSVIQNLLSGKTTEEAYNSAILKNGNNDKDYMIANKDKFQDEWNVRDPEFDNKTLEERVYEKTANAVFCIYGEKDVNYISQNPDSENKNFVTFNVTDNSGNALNNVNVSVLNKGTNQTDSVIGNSGLSLTLSAGTYEITVSKDGYQSVTQTITQGEKEINRVLNITLTATDDPEEPDTEDYGTLTETFSGWNGSKDNFYNVDYYGDTGTLVISGNTKLWIEFSDYEWASQIKQVIIKDGITSIDEDVFKDCTSIKKISISNSVTEIGSYAFKNCSSLEEVSIPNNLQVLEYEVFQNCSSLEKIDIPNSVTSINNHAFLNCTSLTDITISNSLINIGNEAFKNCGYYNDSNNWIDGVLYIGNYLIKAEKTIEGYYQIKQNTKLIGSNAFFECYALEKVVIPNSVIGINSGAFSSCSSLNVIFEDESNLKAIGSFAFSVCNMINFDIPDTVISIGAFAFAVCTNLTEIVIPEGVTIIEDSTFMGCSNLNNVEIPYGVSTIGDSAFLSCSAIKSLTLPGSLKYIEYNAFCGCSSLERLSIPAKVISIGAYAFDECTNLAYISVDENNNEYSNDEYGALFNKDKTMLIKYPAGNIESNYEIPNTVAIIESNSFKNSKSLVSVTIPDSVTNIGYSAFEGCGNLANITIPDSVTSIGVSAFQDCVNLSSIKIGNGVKNIEKCTFWKCESLTNVTIPDSVASIGNQAFHGCGNISDVYYTGKQTEWNTITIGDYNETLTNATIHYNS